MSKYVNIDSKAWCDMVFDEKNKDYGAYKLRQSSSKRHIVALIVVVCITIIVALIPKMYQVVANQAKKRMKPLEEVVAFTDVNLKKDIPQENVIKEDATPPPPPVKLKSTIQHVPPVVVKDEEVTEKDQMKTNEELVESDRQISTQTVEGNDEEFGQDIADLEENTKLTEETFEKPFEVVEQPPAFPGGMAELMKYLSKNIKYPTIAQENGIKGRVILRFVVSPTGDISEVQVLKGVDPSLDKEAIRVVKSMPRWIPGKQQGRAVPVYYTLPVTFQLK